MLWLRLPEGNYIRDNLRSGRAFYGYCSVPASAWEAESMARERTM